jgi:hypothetical protein
MTETHRGILQLARKPGSQPRARRRGRVKAADLRAWKFEGAWVHCVGFIA